MNIDKFNSPKKNGIITMDINVKDYGAVGDGIADDYRAFQDAEDALMETGGSIYVPAGVYNVSQPFVHHNHITLFGDGYRSLIRNAVPFTDKHGKDQFCIHIGNFPPSAFGVCVHYDVEDISAGDDFVTLKKAADAQHFKTGDVILIDSAEGYYNDENLLKPYAAFLNRIVSIQDDRITLEDAISIDVEGAKIAYPQSDKKNEYICIEPVIRDLAFDSLGDWTLRFGVYKGVFENLLIRSVDVIPGNGLSYCRFSNIRAIFSQKVIEMATYSHKSTVENLTAYWWAAGAVDLDNKPLIKMGENVRDCVYSNLTIDAGNGEYFAAVTGFDHAFNNIIEDSDFRAASIQDAGIVATCNDPLGIIDGNIVRRCKFYLRDAKHDVKIQEENGAVISNNDFSGNEFDSTPSKKPIKIEGGVNNKV